MQRSRRPRSTVSRSRAMVEMARSILAQAIERFAALAALGIDQAIFSLQNVSDIEPSMCWPLRSYQQLKKSRWQEDNLPAPL